MKIGVRLVGVSESGIEARVADLLARMRNDAAIGAMTSNVAPAPMLDALTPVKGGTEPPATPVK